MDSDSKALISHKHFTPYGAAAIRPQSLVPQARERADSLGTILQLLPFLTSHSEAGMATPKRDLRSSGSPWLKDRTKPLTARRRPSRSHCDVAIVGAGVSGALAAAALIGAGQSVVILDRRGAAKGSTAASTAMIQWEIDQPLSALSRKLGARTAERAYQSSLRGVMALRRTVFALKVDCDWIDRTALTVSGDAMGQRALAAELKMRQKAGLPSLWMDGSDLTAMYGIERTAALVSGFNAELHPVKLTRGLLQRAIGTGMELVAPVEVMAMTPRRGGVELALSNGSEVRAGKVIACTGYEALPDIPKDRYNLISTWAIASAPMRPAQLDSLLPGRPIIWEQSDPYLYLRTTADGRLVAGGEDAQFNSPERRDGLIPKKMAAIRRKLKEFLPALDIRIAHAWAGTFADSPTGLPAIGPVPGLPNVFATLGAGGNGITFSAIAASIARDWVMGSRHPDLDLYRFA
jgi:glycine/D-amino acid oxidase-like deaminating enzyme